MNYSELGDSFEPSNEFVLQTHIHLSPTDEIKLRKFLNLHYLGDEDCNHLVDGEMVPKYPEKETLDYKTASSRIDRGFYVNLKLTFDVNGIPRMEIATGNTKTQEEITSDSFQIFSNKALESAYEKSSWGCRSGCAQMINGEWWNPVMGCDSLQLVLENAYDMMQSTENNPEIIADMKGIAEELMGNSASWGPDVRLLGNTKAVDITKLCAFVLSNIHSIGQKS
jgi:hypothetical protein